MSFQRLCMASILFYLSLFHDSLWGAIMRGKVTDESGAPIAGVQMTFADMYSKRVYKMKTNKSGDYVHGGVNARGKYMVTVEKEGYQATGRQNLTVHYDLPNVLNFQLRVGDRGLLDFEVPLEERLRKQQDAKKALAAQKALIEATRMMKASSTLEASGKTTEAIVKLEEAVAVKPDAVQAWVKLGQLRLKLKFYNPAIEAIQKAISFQPDNPSLREQLGKVYSAQGQGKEAKKQYAQSHFLSAKALINQNKNKEALEILEKTLEVDAKHAEAYYELGVILISLGRIDDGLNRLKRYQKLSPNGLNIETAQALLQQLGK